jgi:hypothetical protein
MFLDVDAVIDYARRSGEMIRWQGFASTSSDIRVALGFPGSVLFEISVSLPVVSLSSISVCQSEQEFVLTPYQWFVVNDVRWDAKYQRWIFAVDEGRDGGRRESWLGRYLDGAVPGEREEPPDVIALHTQHRKLLLTFLRFAVGSFVSQRFPRVKPIATDPCSLKNRAVLGATGNGQGLFEMIPGPAVHPRIPDAAGTMLHHMLNMKVEPEPRVIQFDWMCVASTL